MSVQTFEIETDDFYIKVEVDRARMTDAALEEINNFWSGAEERLEEAGGDLLKAVLQQLFRHIRYIVAAHGGLIREQVLDAFRYGEEGWPTLAGDEGLRLVDAYMEIHLDDELRYREVTA